MCLIDLCLFLRGEGKRNFNMAVYYKFKSAKDYDSIAIDGHFISVANLKEKIFESKHLGRGTDFDLVVTNAQTNEGWFDSLKQVDSVYKSDYFECSFCFV